MRSTFLSIITCSSYHTGWAENTIRASVPCDTGRAPRHDSNRAYKCGFTVVWIVYVVFWVLLVRGRVPPQAAFAAMGTFTGGSCCL